MAFDAASFVLFVAFVTFVFLGYLAIAPSVPFSAFGAAALFGSLAVLFSANWRVDRRSTGVPAATGH